jgi:hypothetical protein
MSKHVSRKQRWTRDGPTRYTSADGTVVYEQRAWYAVLAYQLLAEEAPPPAWVAQAQRLGPFKRPRNAMVALEREATLLRNRHGVRIRIGGAARG